MSNELIVHASCEGGDLTLYGMRVGRDWLFSLHLFDQTMSWVDGGPEVEHDSEVVRTWTAALKLLDKYDFHRFHPLEVHPGFRAKVLTAVVSRNRRDGNEHCANEWQRVCDTPNMVDLRIELVVEEIKVPSLGPVQGQLFAAAASISKLSHIEKTDWAFGILGAVLRKGGVGVKKPVLAIPRSFWPLGTNELVEQAATVGFEYIDLLDEWVDHQDLMDDWDKPHVLKYMTPIESVRQILDRLRRGDDVIVLSHTKKISDFVRAILFLVSLSHREHPAKVWEGLAQGRSVELTQFQRGYVSGLANACGLFSLEEFRTIT